MPEQNEIRAGILTVSDRSSRGERPDRTGPVIEELLTSMGWRVSKSLVIPDDLEKIKGTLIEWVEKGDIDLLFTAGGTGFSARDITPEATSQIIDRPAPGLTEVMRARSMQITPHAMLSRAVAGIRGRTLVINLPGSPKAAREHLEVVLPVLGHAVQLLRDDPQAESGHLIPEDLSDL